MITDGKLRFIISNIIFIGVILLYMYFMYIDFPGNYNPEVDAQDINFVIFMTVICYAFFGGMIPDFKGKDSPGVLYPPIIEYFTRSVRGILVGLVVVLLINVIIGVPICLYRYDDTMSASIFYGLFTGVGMFIGISLVNYPELFGRVTSLRGSNSTKYRRKYLGIDNKDNIVSTGSAKQDKINAVQKHINSKNK